MPGYSRLKKPAFDTDDSELFEVGGVGMNFLEKIAEGEPVAGHLAEGECVQQHKSVRDHAYSLPSPENLNSTKLQYSKGCPDSCRSQQPQQEQQEQQVSENGNPNVHSPEPPAQPTVMPNCSHSSSATGTSLQELQRGGAVPRLGASASGRWAGRNTGERSGRCQAAGWESYHRDSPASFVESDNINSHSPQCGQWTPSKLRGTSCREREPVLDRQSRETCPSRAAGTPSQRQHPQPHHKQSWALQNSPCQDVRHCQRRSSESSARECLFNDSMTVPEKKTLPPAMHPRADATYGGCFSPRLSQERNPTFQRSNSGRAAPPGLQRSSSTRDTPGHPSEMAIENWRDHPASRSVHGSDKTRHRVSFSFTENHELETQELQEKWSEPAAPRKNVLQVRQDTNQLPPRCYNEQPGFVEHEKENVCGGKAYAMYGMKEVKECPKGSSVRHPQLVRAFSVRENNSNYSKISRAYSVNAGGRHVMPMECDTCGKGGIGIVFLGLPGSEASFCKACKSSSESGRSCPDNEQPKKKKSIMDYCRKVLRLPPKPR